MADSSVVGALRVLLTADSAQFETAMKSASGAMTRLSKDFGTIGRQMTDVGGVLTKSLTVPLLALGAGLFKVGSDFEKANDQIRQATGATGAALDDLNASFKRVMGTVPNSMKQSAEAIGALATRTGLTGTALETLTTQMLNLSRVGKSEIGPLVQATTRAFGDWSIATEDQSAALDYLWKTSQSTGIGITELTNMVVQFGAPMRALGFSFEQATALMGKWEKEGVNSETVLSGLRFALGKFAAAGKEPAAAFAEVIEKIKGAKTETEATAIAFANFGKRAAVDMSRAIIEGRFNIDELVQSLKNSKESINAAAEDTLDFAERMALLKNRTEAAVEPLGTAFVKALEHALDIVSPLIEKIGLLAGHLTKLPGWVQGSAFAFLGLSAAVGPIVYTFGKLFEGASTLIGIFGKKGIALRALTSGYEAVGKASAAVGGIWGVTVTAGALAGMYAADKLTQSTQAATDAFKRGDVTAQNFADALKNSFARGINPVRSFIADVKQAWHDWDNFVQVLLGTPITLPDVPRPKMPTTEAMTVPGLPSPKELKEIEAQLKDGLTPSIDDSRSAIEKFRAELGRLSDNELASLKTDLESGGLSLKELAQTYGISVNAIRIFKADLKDGVQAQKDANKAADEYAASLDRMDAAMERAGLTTQSGLSKELGALIETLNVAARQGPVALEAALSALGTKFTDLADAARRSGLDVGIVVGTYEAFAAKLGHTAQAMEDWERSLPIRPIGDLTAGLQSLTIETQIQQTEQQRLTEAYAAFGLQAPQDLQKAADAATRNYQVLLESGTATTAQLKEAYAKMIEAQREATGQLPSLWEAEVLPRIKNVLDTITGASSQAFGDILVGARGFKDAFVDVWHSIQRSIAAVLSAILNDFIGRFLKGLLGAMTGAQGGFAGAFAGMFGGGGGLGGILTNGGGIFGGMLGGGGAAGVGSDMVLGSGLPGAAGGGLFGMGALGTAGLIGGAALGGYGLYRWLTRGQRQNMAANDSRDAFTSQFGGTGTGAGSGFATLAGKLTEATGEAGGGHLFDAFINARKPEEVAKAIEAINAALDAYAQKTQAATDAEAAQTAQIDATKAALEEKTNAIHEQMKGLDDELAKLNASEAPEAHMGVVEQQTRDRIAREKDDLQRQLDAAKEAAAAAIEAIKAAGTASSDELATQGQTVIDGWKDGFLDLHSYSQEQIDAIRLMLEGLGKNIPTVHVPVKYDYPEGPDQPQMPTAAHATGWVGSTPHVALIAEGGEAEMVGPVSFMSRALEGALARVGGMGSRQSITIMEIDKREIGRAIADVLPGELRRLGVRVRT